AHHASLVGPHHIAHLLLQANAEGKVHRQEEPGVTTAFGNRFAGAVRQRIGVVGVVHRVGRTLRVGHAHVGRVVHDGVALLLLRYTGHGQGHTRVGQVVDQVHTTVVPLARLGGTHVSLVLVVSENHLNGLAEHGPAKVLHGHLHGLHRTLARDVGIHAGNVGQHTDAQHIV